MEKIKLRKLEIKDNRVVFRFSVSEKIKPFLKADSFFIEYSENVSNIPISVLSVAFVGNFLPFAWFFDAEISIDELDEDFHDCLPKIREGYEYMYPKWRMGGKVCCGRLVKNNTRSMGKSAAFFSGGLDAVQTLLAHIDEKPDLLSIWGADVASSNVEGWAVMHAKIADVAKGQGLSNHVIRNNFRSIEQEGELHCLVKPVLGDGWWHGIKHAIAMFGMVAPIAYKFGYERLYIASSHCKAIGMATCASNPWVDNAVRFCGCQVIHDGYEYERQDKARFVVEECQKRSLQIPLHVCWKTQTGENCCQCEKCFRTITEILVEGGDPKAFGFDEYEKHYNFSSVVSTMRRTFYEENKIGRKDLNRIWQATVPRIKARESELRTSPYWPIFNWMRKHDFMSTKDITLPLGDRIASCKARARRFASRIYHKMLG